MAVSYTHTFIEVQVVGFHHKVYDHEYSELPKFVKVSLGRRNENETFVVSPFTAVGLDLFKQVERLCNQVMSGFRSPFEASLKKEINSKELEHAVYEAGLLKNVMFRPSTEIYLLPADTNKVNKVSMLIVDPNEELVFRKQPLGMRILLDWYADMDEISMKKKEGIISKLSRIPALGVGLATAIGIMASKPSVPSEAKEYTYNTIASIVKQELLGFDEMYKIYNDTTRSIVNKIKEMCKTIAKYYPKSIIGSHQEYKGSVAHLIDFATESYALGWTESLANPNSRYSFRVSPIDISMVIIPSLIPQARIFNVLTKGSVDCDPQLVVENLKRFFDETNVRASA